jgi:hypothetical protein
MQTHLVLLQTVEGAVLVIAQHCRMNLTRHAPHQQQNTGKCLCTSSCCSMVQQAAYSLCAFACANWHRLLACICAAAAAAGYGGPYPIEKVSIGYGGYTDPAKFPPVGAAANLPKEAGPNYQHIAFVELDRCVQEKVWDCHSMPCFYFQKNVELDR